VAPWRCPKCSAAVDAGWSTIPHCGEPLRPSGRPGRRHAARAALARCRGKQTGETPLFHALHDSLQADDLVLADRDDGSWWELALVRRYPNVPTTASRTLVPGVATESCDETGPGGQ